MASYSNPYNKALMERQLYNNYAGIQNDFMNAYQQPLHGGDFFSDFMDGFNMVMKPVGDAVSTVAPFLPLLGLGDGECRCGAGMSGGDEVKDTDMVGMVNRGLPQRYAQYFLGGRDPRSVPARERRMLLRKALADAKLQRELKMIMKAKKGAGMSGGDGFDWSSLLSFAPLLLGLGESDADEVYADMMGDGFWDDVGDFFTSLPSKVVETGKSALDLAEKGLKKGSELAEQAKPLIDVYKALSGEKKKEGGAMTYEQNMNMADAMGDIFSGMGVSGGADAVNTPYTASMPLNVDAPPASMPKKPKLLDKSRAIQEYKGGDQCVNAPYVCDNTRIPVNLQNRPTKAYLEMTGNGEQDSMDGGDWWSDFMSGLQSVIEPIGNIAKVVAPLVGGAEDCPTREIGGGVSGGKRSSAWINHVKAYAKQHGIKYNEALKRAGATYKK